MILSDSVVRRFEAYCGRAGEDDCWIWQSSCDAAGYGQISDKPNRTVHKAHRVSYFLEYGEIPEGLGVLHRCNNRPCVNHKHLYAGTDAQNFADMIAAGRHVPPPIMRGNDNPHSILTEDDVRYIRQCDLAVAELARSLAVSKSTIYAVRSRQNWAHVP